jgi:hypothetical protein
MVKKIKVQIEGLRPYLQHRRASSQQEVEQMNKIIKILQKNSFDLEASKQEAEMGAYKNGEGYYIPAEQIQEALINAGARIQVKGQGKRTYKNYMKSYVFVEPQEILLTPQEYQLDRRYVKVHGSGINRNRPRFDNWKATFQLLITDDSLPLKDIKEILEIAGSRVGIGDYRPRYGLFSVVSFEN